MIERVRPCETTCALWNSRAPQEARMWAFGERTPGEVPPVGLTEQDLAVRCFNRFKQGMCTNPPPTESIITSEKLITEE